MPPTEPLPPSVADLVAHPHAVRRRYPISSSHKWRISGSSLHQPSTSFLARLLPFSPQPQPPLPVDTPSASFYRLYQFFVIDWTVQFRNELEYFCTDHPEWAVADLPDPADPDLLRYAVLAVLTRLMCQAFNYRIVNLSLPRDAPPIIEDFEEVQARPKIVETVPVWAERVARLAEPVHIPDANGDVLAEDDDGVSPEFKDMNIIVGVPHIHFV